MFKKYNIRLIFALLTSCLSIQSQTINAINTPNASIYVKQNLKSGKHIKPSDHTIKAFYNIFDNFKIFRSNTYKSAHSCANRYIGHLSKCIKLNKCPPYNYFEALTLISSSKLESENENKKWSCPYCGYEMIWTENCTCPNPECLSIWVKSVCKFKAPIMRIRNTSAYRERLCLLPAFLILICDDYSGRLEFEPIARKWAVEILIAGHNQDWKYIDKVFKKSVSNASTICDIKNWLELAYQTYASN